MQRPVFQRTHAYQVFFPLPLKILQRLQPRTARDARHAPVSADLVAQRAFAAMWGRLSTCGRLLIRLLIGLFGMRTTVVAAMLLCGTVGQPIVAAAGFPAGWSGLHVQGGAGSKAGCRQDCLPHRAAEPQPKPALSFPSRPINNRPQVVNLPHRAAEPQPTVSSKRGHISLLPPAGRLTIGRRLPTCPTNSLQAAKILGSSSTIRRGAQAGATQSD